MRKLLLICVLFSSAMIYSQSKENAVEFTGTKAKVSTNLNTHITTKTNSATNGAKGCGNAGFYDIESGSPYYCNDTIWLTTWDTVDASGFISPAFGVTVVTNSYSDTENHIYIYEDGVLFYNDYDAIPENSEWTLYGGYMDPDAIYTYEFCDDNIDENFDWWVQDYTNNQTLASGNWDFDVSGAPSCYSVDFGPLGGTYEYVTNATSGFYDFGNGQAGFVCSEAGPGTYTFYYQFTNGAGDCSGTSATQTITVAGPTANAGTTQTTCAGTAVTIGGSPTGTDGVPGYTYTWSPTAGLSSSTAANPTANPSSTTTYTVTVTDVDGNGCDDISTVVVNVNPNPTPVISGNSSVCANGTYTYSTTDISGNSYVWVVTGGTISSGAGTSSITVDWGTGATGNIQLTETIDATGCDTPTSLSVTINALPNVTASSDDADNAICNGDAITLNGGGASTYTWDNGVNDGSSFIPTGTLTYEVTGQDTLGCENTAQITITVNPLPNVYAGADQDITYGSSTTINDATPTGLVSYAWTPTDSLVDATIQHPTTEILHITNTFTLTGTDANGCTNSDDVVINIIGGPLSVSLSAIQNDSICYGDSVIIIASASGASGTYTYNWSSNPTGTYPDNDTIIVNPTVATEYYIHVVDGTNNAYDTITITVNPLPVISNVTATDLQCNGDDSGEINISATGSGSLSYSINDGIDYYSNNGQFSNMSVGTGFITVVEDEFGCIAYGDTIDISQPTPLTVNISSLNDATCGTANGNITLTTSGGTPSYNYVWYTGQTPTIDSSYIDVLAGNYIVTITDSQGCEDTIHYIIDDLGGGTVNITSSVDANCYNENSGSMVATITGGTPSYIYYLVQDNDTLINEASSNSTFTLDTLLAGSYTLYAQEGVGCISSDTFTINQPTEITLTDSIIDIRCWGVNDGQIFITADGGTPGYSYLWSNGEISSSVESLSFGNYSVIITDDNGCTKTKDSLWIHTPLKLVADVQIDNFILCYNDSVGSLTAVADSGTAPYTYLWNNSETTATINNLTAGNYSVTVFDDHGCTVEIDTSLTTPTELIVTDSIYSENYYGVISTSTIGGSPSYSYLWSNGASDSVVSYLISGNYYLTVTDANNCTVNLFYNIDIPLVIPSVITPNADGKNDKFRITNIASAKEVDIKMFNRWGDVIFEYSGTGYGYDDASTQWDGTYNGKELPMGSYVYIIDLKNDKDPYTGTVTIVR